MRMTDLMSGAALSLFPMIGLVIFGLIFLAMTVRVLRSSNSEARRHSAMPLEEGATLARTDRTPRELASNPNAPERTDA